LPVGSFQLYVASFQFSGTFTRFDPRRDGIGGGRPR
jgi:hypothetical protein